MNKKVVIAASVALAVLLAALVFAMFAFVGDQDGSSHATEPVMTTEETAVATTEVNLPGLEDSIFPDDDEETEPSETTEATIPETQPTEETTKPTEPKPTEPKSTEPQLKDPDPIEPKPTNPKPTEPKPTEPKPTEPSKPTDPVTPSDPTEPTGGETVEKDFEWFQNLAPADQQAWMESFATIDAFFGWYNEAKEAHEKANPPIEFNGDPIDIGAIINGKK